MTDLFLIAHKARSEPAFDIACQMICPECDGDGKLSNGIIDITGDDGVISCHECDGLGYWWIIPTSGHRAYPYWNVAINMTGNTLYINQDWVASVLFEIPELPSGLPDHYPTRAAPTISLIDTLGLRKPKAQVPTVPVARRF